MKKILLTFICIFFLIGCSSNDSTNNLISYMEAKEKIINENAILVDVRTEEEYNEDHIDGATSLPLSNINETNIKDITTTKDDIIIVYCQSGNRSSQALTLLKDLGYKNVYDLDSINNWQE